MAVKLKTDEVTVVTQTLEINQEITDDEKRPLGLACAEVVENFDWDADDPGHDVLKQLLKDVKNALGVRVSRKKKDKPKKKRASKKAKKKPAPEADASKDPEPTSSPTQAASAAKSNGAADEGQVESAAPAETGAPLHDPFAVPAGDSAQ